MMAAVIPRLDQAREALSTVAASTARGTIVIKIAG
jgi:hypothetical protein